MTQDMKKAGKLNSNISKEFFVIAKQESIRISLETLFSQEIGIFNY